MLYFANSSYRLQDFTITNPVRFYTAFAFVSRFAADQDLSPSRCPSQNLYQLSLIPGSETSCTGDIDLVQLLSYTSHHHGAE